MTGAELIAELDDHGFADTSTTRKELALADSYWDICSREPWPFLEKSANVNTVAAQSKLDVPADFSKSIALVIPSLNRKLEPERLDTIYKKFDLSVQDIPSYYYFIGSELNLWPVPNSILATKLAYLHSPIELASGTAENAIVLPIRHHRLILLGALVKLYSMEDDTELANHFERQFERRLEVMREDVWMRQYDRPDYLADLEYDYFYLDDAPH